MKLLQTLNLLASFLLELCLLAAAGYWGYAVGPSTFAKIGLACGAPVLVAMLWGVLMAPRSPRRLKTPWYTIMAAILFGLASAGLYGAGQPYLAGALLFAWAINTLLAYLWKQGV